nr:MAG TPA: hypothetical protein [Caudoviricetes sp.]
MVINNFPTFLKKVGIFIWKFKNYYYLCISIKDKIK